MIRVLRHIPTLSAVVLAVVLQAACGPAHRLKVGMTQTEVEQIMGAPTGVVGDPRKIREELPHDAACADSAARVLIYQLEARRHVRLGVDAKGIVRCVVHTVDLVH